MARELGVSQQTVYAHSQAGFLVNPEQAGAVRGRLRALQEIEPERRLKRRNGGGGFDRPEASVGWAAA